MVSRISFGETQSPTRSRRKCLGSGKPASSMIEILAGTPGENRHHGVDLDLAPGAGPHIGDRDGPLANRNQSRERVDSRAFFGKPLIEKHMAGAFHVSAQHRPRGDDLHLETGVDQKLDGPRGFPMAIAVDRPRPSAPAAYCPTAPRRWRRRNPMSSPGIRSGRCRPRISASVMRAWRRAGSPASRKVRLRPRRNDDHVGLLAEEIARSPASFQAEIDAQPLNLLARGGG